MPPGNKIHVLDAGTVNIRMFSKQGESIGTYCSEGSGNGELNRPVAVTLIDEVTLLVSDTGNNRCAFFAIVDVVSTIEFDNTGDFIASGDKGGRVVIFDRMPQEKASD